MPNKNSFLRYFKIILGVLLTTYSLCFIYGMYKMKYQPSKMYKEILLVGINNKKNYRQQEMGSVDYPKVINHGSHIDSIKGAYKFIKSANVNDTPKNIVGEKKARDPKPKTLADAKNIFRKGQIRDKVTSANLEKIIGSSRNVYQAAKAYRFDRFKSNVERYEAYGDETFKKLGFNPFDDNEAYYNAKTTGWQDFKRSSRQFLVICSIAFNYNPIRQFLYNDLFNDFSNQANDEIDQSMRIGLSTRGGFWQWLCNSILYSAFLFGNVIFWFYVSSFFALICFLYFYWLRPFFVHNKLTFIIVLLFLLFLILII